MPTSQTKLVHLFWSACQNGLIFYFVHHTGQAHQEQEEDPRVTKILNFLSEHNVAIPSSRRKLTIWNQNLILKALCPMVTRMVPTNGNGISSQ